MSCIVGGNEYTVVGWGQYELERRQAAAAHGGNPGAEYPGRTYIGGADVIQSVFARRKNSPLTKAARRLANALKSYESQLLVADLDDDLTNVLAIPVITSADLNEFADTADEEVDTETMFELSDLVTATLQRTNADCVADTSAAAAAAATLRARPAGVPPAVVAITDSDAVLKLEISVGDTIKSIEEVRSALASQFDEAAKCLSARLRVGGRPGPRAGTRAGTHTRAEEVAAAIKAGPPHIFMQEGLPFEGTRVFDYPFQDTGTHQAGELPGIFFGEGYFQNDSSRTTLLTPKMISWAAFHTSGQVYAWVLLDSVEACYAIRAAAPQSRVQIDPDVLTHELRMILVGSPPHKAPVADWVKIVRRHVEIHVGKRRSAEARFDLAAMTTPTERAAEIQRLQAFTAEDFAAMDWSEYDEKVGARVCDSSLEVAGDIELVEGSKGSKGSKRSKGSKKTKGSKGSKGAKGAKSPKDDKYSKNNKSVVIQIKVPKIRTGLKWTSQPHRRSYIQFHSHPWDRYRGRHPEPPSSGDLHSFLVSAQQGIFAWHFISAPEGVYIIRPSALAAEQFEQDPDKFLKTNIERYLNTIHGCNAIVKVCAEQVIPALNDAGFVAYYRAAAASPGHKCPISDVPDLVPGLNLTDRGEYLKSFKTLSAMTTGELAAMDWSAVTAAGSTATIQHPSWFSAGIERVSAGIERVSEKTADKKRPYKVILNTEGHQFYVEHPFPEPDRYNPLGPIFIVYFPGDISANVFEEFGPALQAVMRQANLWACLVIMNPSRAVVFRAGTGDKPEIYGPVRRTKTVFGPV